MTHSSVRLVRPLLTAVVVICAVSIERAAAYPDGPPDGFAGNPPNFLSCVLCHGDYPENSGDGALELLGLPPAYSPGTVYDLTVRLRDPGQMRWGFELTVFAPANQASGTLAVTDATNTQLSNNPGTNPDYLKHTLDGTYSGTTDGPVTWNFQWTAPNDETATFYLAGNAAEGGNDPSGDYIYTLVQALEQATVTVGASTWSGVKALYRR